MIWAGQGKSLECAAFFSVASSLSHELHHKVHPSLPAFNICLAEAHYKAARKSLAGPSTKLCLLVTALSVPPLP